MPPPKEKPSQDKPNQGYNTYVKRTQLKSGKGRYRSLGFVKANKQPLSREAAIGKGMEVTDTYANRSFRIEKAKGDAQPDPSSESQTMIRGNRFRYSKKNPEVFVEKTEYAINTMEEKDKIPYEAARQRKHRPLSMPRMMARTPFRR